MMMLVPDADGRERVLVLSEHRSAVENELTKSQRIGYVFRVVVCVRISCTSESD